MTRIIDKIASALGYAPKRLVVDYDVLVAEYDAALTLMTRDVRERQAENNQLRGDIARLREKLGMVPHQLIVISNILADIERAPKLTSYELRMKQDLQIAMDVSVNRFMDIVNQDARRKAAIEAVKEQQERVVR